ncbi:HAD family hydrolase [Bulleidia sp. zg-1006]|uniref:HAD family hydrolase n=1 Tax=Bulleidia sp. zg-1006 TaxID=2806552 RepID=UPI00193A41C5|nr:HAD family hydrolase [Bulleidia sp. zg-1006]QRG86632.1 HAD family hydrolase [Bulleidia sp. zg-1006]
MIKGILFDFDGTVSYRYKAAFEMYHWFLEQIDPSLKEDVLRKEEILQRCLLWDQYGTINKCFALEQLKARYYPDLEIEKMYRLWYQHFHKHQYLMPNAKETIVRLKKKYQIGMITNGPTESQLMKVEALGMRDDFHPLLVSEAFGCAKPNPKIYLAAVKEMDLKPKEVVFVGDTFSTDIVGAIRAGLIPIWFCYERKGITNLDIAQVSSYQELEECLERMNCEKEV